ncbi:preprotein translocase subunit TatA [Methylobacterium sp. Leaf123]|uniref:Sec-independent protein translocase protein TatB n=1 Tax=Methylobacterium sp. Leaf123 TaxID=1736264 RepID=UPI0006FFD23D|nr:Sec-independent protein translocase protein TatB [Methylobacterium sp. Leaf123]KQQ13102.1 preprotein translocase subunit TatA [Methylobacterium sp. Leaf123]
MLDMSWGEVMLIGGVALIVIGPKDLPKALRTLGQITTKVRRMAGEFQSQFNEAIREAELDEVRRDVEGVKRTVDSARPTFNPVDTIRNEIRSAVEGRPGSGSNSAGAKDTGSFDVPRPTPGPQADPMHGAPAQAVETSPIKPETGPTP